MLTIQRKVIENQVKSNPEHVLDVLNGCEDRAEILSDKLGIEKSEQPIERWQNAKTAVKTFLKSESSDPHLKESELKWISTALLCHNGMIRDEGYKLVRKRTIRKIEDGIGTVRANRPDDPEAVSYALDDLERTINEI